MPRTALDVYVAAFLARGAVGRTGGATVHEPGLCGTLPSAHDQRIRVLVTDDRAHDVLAAALAHARAGTITVFAQAPRCTALAGRLGWRSKPLTAMAFRDLRAVPSLSLPGELSLRPVRRLAADAPDGVALETAAAAARRADPAIDEPPDEFVAFLRSMPPGVRLLAAIDPAGTVRATSGSGVYGDMARVFFVNTDPAWRGRGIGRAMTAAALCAARDAGARHAALDATGAGRSIYRRLGAEVVAELTQFFRTR